MSRKALLRERSLVALLTAEIVSTAGAQMTWIALPWFVLTTTGSASRMSLVMAAELAGFALAGIPSGGLLERIGARRTMLAADGLRAPLMALVPILHWSGHLSLPALVAIAIALGALSAPYFAAQKILVPELVGEDEQLVGQASALFQGAIRVTLLLGPPLGGVLIAWLGAASVLLVDAATYLVAFALVALGVPPSPRAAKDEDSHGVLAGLRFLVREPLLRSWGTWLIIGDTAWMAFFAAVPVLVVTRFEADPRVAGILLAAFGLGAIAGNLLAYRVLLERVEGLRLISTCAIGQAAPLWLLPLDVPAWALVAALAASGLANGLVNPSLHAIQTLRIPPALRARTLTAYGTVFAVVTPLGLLAAGPVLDAFGVRPVFVAVAAIQTIAMAAISYAALRARQAPESMPAPAPVVES